ncbi:MAG TPA: hypothetical protein VJX73_05035 [Terracidiphilus sp.]|nr:hypothetical protein [Terracidiphilus sp.]
MVVVPLTKSVRNAGVSGASEATSMSWIRIAAAGTLAASGALLVAGKRRAGLVTAVTGAALVMLDQQEVVSQWWNALPAYLDEIQGMLSRAQCAVEDLSVQGEKLRRVLGK